VTCDVLRRYLEELSQRYKRQMDDMYSSLNKTIAKLSNTAKSAEDRVGGYCCFSLYCINYSNTLSVSEKYVVSPVDTLVW